MALVVVAASWVVTAAVMVMGEVTMGMMGMLTLEMIIGGGRVGCWGDEISGGYHGRVVVSTNVG